MTGKEKQQLKILIIFLAVLGLSSLYAYRMNQPQTASAVQTPQAAQPANPAVPNDARIRLDLVEKPAPEDVGRNNLFQYRFGQAAQAQQPPAFTPPPVVVNQPPPGPLPPSLPPPPPPIPLRYQGYAHAQTGLTAFLADGERQFNVMAGEVLMGRYRVLRVSESLVEVEDLEYNRRQILTLVK